MAPYSAEVTQNDELPLTLSYQVESKKQVPCNLQAPFEILNKYGSQLKRFRSGKRCEPSLLKHLETEKTNGLSSEMGGNTSNCQVLSAVSIMRMAKTELPLSNSQKTGDNSTLANPFEFDSRLAPKHAKHLKRVLCLLDAAEKLSNQRYDQAEELLILVLSDSHADHPVGRVVTCFALDIMERIYVENGKIDLEREVVHVDVEQALMDLKPAILANEQKLPFSQITHFTAIQTILDSVASAERIHFIDIGKKLGSHWILMMHALANRKKCRLEQLKITVVCTPKDDVEETDCPKNIEALIGGLKNLNPHLMVVSEIEANTSASTFIDRFHEALFICSAMFDCQEDCLERDNPCREIVEKVYFQEIIRNGVISEGDESFNQHRKIDFWREYFGSFGIVETELSQSSMYQASLLICESPCWSSCTLSMDGKCMLLGWNGIPLRSVSAWKFQHD
ncbi:hypothetical protein Pfo_025961 [Paulownia fortunei]|nr:hypothetical protein Pfo_025961 [Paulownia fortunei]